MRVRGARAHPFSMLPRPWLAHYDANVPHTLSPYPERSLVELVRDTARERPEHPAILFKGHALSYSELDRRSTALASALAADGVRKGDRVALVLPNCPQFVIAELAIWKAGGIVMPLNPLYTERELETPLREGGAVTVVALTRFYDRVKAVQPRTGVRRVIATNIKEYFPPWLRLLFTVFKEKKDGHRIRLAAEDRWFGDLIAEGAGQPVPSVPVSLDDPAVILASGGTTGTPKGVVGTHRAYVMAGLQLRTWTRALCEEWRDAILLPLPMFHVYANVGVQAKAFVGRNPLGLVPNPRDLDDLLKTIKKVRPVFFTAVPTLFAALLNHPDVRSGRADFSSIKVSFSGAAALLAETKRRFESLTGGRIVEGYSLTEGMMACLANPLLGVSKIGSVGVPLPDVEVQIVDSDDPDRLMDTGRIGEVILRAPQLMTGYWKNEAETAQALRTGPSGGTWLYTGDLGYMDEDGYVFLVDRKKDMIKTSGYQVWPREIEEVIAAHPAVAEVGVAGQPDAVRGEAVAAWIVLRPGNHTTADNIRSWCRERLAAYKVPTTVIFRGELPKTMVGKVLRRALASEAREESAGEPSPRNTV
jgi:long-chain acyl-CoA synthetase